MNTGTPRNRGLESIKTARAARKLGRGAKLTPQVALYAGALVIASIVGYRFLWSRNLENTRKSLIAKQQATVNTVGVEWNALQGDLERFAIEGASPTYAGDRVSPELATWKFESQPGLWLRIRLAEAKAPETLRAAAQYSVRDSFTTCFLKEAATPVRAEDPDAGAIFPEQPWNVKRAYQATKVLGTPWLTEVQNATDDLRMGYFASQFEKAEREEIPVAIDIVKKARFFLLLLDEDVPAATQESDAGLFVSDLSLVPHPVRIFLVNLKTKEVVLRLRASADGEFRSVTETALSEESRKAIQRQVNNCSLAGTALKAMGRDTEKKAPGSFVSPAGSPAAGSAAGSGDVAPHTPGAPGTSGHP